MTHNLFVTPEALVAHDAAEVALSGEGLRTGRHLDSAEVYALWVAVCTRTDLLNPEIGHRATKNLLLVLCHSLIFGLESEILLAWTALRLNSNPKF